MKQPATFKVDCEAYDENELNGAQSTTPKPTLEVNGLPMPGTLEIQGVAEATVEDKEFSVRHGEYKDSDGKVLVAARTNAYPYKLTKYKFTSELGGAPTGALATEGLDLMREELGEVKQQLAQALEDKRHLQASLRRLERQNDQLLTRLLDEKPRLLSKEKGEGAGG